MYAPKKWMKGSPPRMRGKDGVNDSAQAVTGITPAYAGKSHTLVGELPHNPFGITPAYAGKRTIPHNATSLHTWKDHPRVCGEKGKQLVKIVVEFAGITPACAGKSCSSSVSMQPAACRGPSGPEYDAPRIASRTRRRTTAGRSSGACAATSNAIGMVTSALYRSAMSYTKEHSCPTCTNPSPGAHPSATMTAWASPYR